MTFVAALAVVAFAAVAFLYVHRRHPAMPIPAAATEILDDLGELKTAIGTFVDGKVKAALAPVEAERDAAKTDLAAANDKIASMTTDDADGAAAIKAGVADLLATVTPAASDGAPPAPAIDPLTGQPVAAA